MQIILKKLHCHYKFVKNILNSSITYVVNWKKAVQITTVKVTEKLPVSNNTLNTS